jgi:hypothetical protein
MKEYLSQLGVVGQILNLVWILVLVVVILALLAVAYLNLRRVMGLSEDVDRMVKAQKQAYPNGELPAPLRRENLGQPMNYGAGSVPWRFSPESTAGPDQVVIDPTEEYPAPYYRRTRHLVSSIYVHNPQDVRTGNWYGFDEWVQDILCGKVPIDTTGEGSDASPN